MHGIVTVNPALVTRFLKQSCYWLAHTYRISISVLKVSLSWSFLSFFSSYLEAEVAILAKFNYAATEQKWLKYEFIRRVARES